MSDRHQHDDARHSTGSNRKPTTVETVALILILAPPVLLLGGVHQPMQLGLLAVYLVGLGVAAGRRLARGRLLVWHASLTLPLGLAIVSLLQTVPLPIAWVDALAPLTAGSVRAVDAAFGEATLSAPLTLDVEATRGAAVRWLAVAAAMLWLLQVTRRRATQHRVVHIAIALGAFVAGLGLLQGGLGIDRIYGLYEPLQLSPQGGYGGPFVNPNHAGHLCLVAATAAMVLASRRRQTVAGRWTFPAAIALCALGMVVMDSRGALVGLAIGVLVHVVISRRHGKARRQETLERLVVAGALTLALLGVFALQVPEIGRFFRPDSLTSQLDVSKIELQRLGATVASRSPGVGIGGDAFGSVQVALVPLTKAARFSHVENDYLQVLVDYGFVAPTVLLALAIWAWRRRARASDRRGPPNRWWVVAAPFALYSLANFAWASLGVVVVGYGVLLARFFRPRRLRLAQARAVALLSGLLALDLVAIAMAGATLTSSDGLEPRVEARIRPLSARHLWATATESEPGAIAPSVVDSLALRAEVLSGNDAFLQEVLGRYWLGRGDVERAARLFERALDSHPGLVTHVDDWVRLMEEPGVLARACEASEAMERAVLRGLLSSERYADALSVALLRPDSPFVLHSRIRASLGLEERVLADFSADVLEDMGYTTVDGCRWRARGLWRAGRREAALEAMAACLDLAPRDAGILHEYLRWTLNDGESDDQRVDELLRRFRDAVAHDTVQRRYYYRLLALRQAGRGQCQAAELSHLMTRGPDGEILSLPAWVRERCPAWSEQAGEP